MKKDNLHKNNGGFKVPENYFESLESELSKKILSDSKNTELLSNKIESGFKPPIDYFETFENELLQKIKEDESKEKGVLISLITRKNILYLSGIAAMIAIILSISISKESELNFNDIEVADIHTYISEGNLELSNTEIAMLLEDTNYIETYEDELIDDDALLDYLSEEDLEDEIIFVE
ncbi:hypothetical protein [Aquimarina sediminis]|uniref:hypothetical protein n=1 Tax=Aquimarina sediminis TaxID=2070536 RepID=UPI000CA0691C|nr:hypothetical protein [Aquimarina sediminis]